LRFCFSDKSKNELYRIIVRKVEEHNTFECAEFFEHIHKIIDRSMYISNPRKIPQQLSTDIGDQPFIELAVHSNASFLITDDYSNGLLELGRYANVSIVNSSRFIRLYNRITRASR